ncbi:alpha/beta hydrolase [Candidatus Saccharibacteria bacterium]|nr:alpha/beta hydrolase [Candidatus Saccharibacteria bacterium]
MQSIVSNIATHYTRSGKGRVIVLLHGWGDGSQSWQSFANKLASDYDVIVPDLPGFGGTEAPKEAWNVMRYAEFVRDLIHKIGVQPYAIIGHSNGGAIAVKGVGQGMFQAEKLILLASAGVRNPRANPGLQVIAKVGKVVAAPLPSKVRNKLRRKLYQKAGSDLLVAEHMQDTFKKIVRDDVRADAAYISTPTLLVYGDADTETPIEIAHELHSAIEGSRLLILPGVGHHVHSEAEDVALKTVREFLHA